MKIALLKFHLCCGNAVGQAPVSFAGWVDLGKALHLLSKSRRIGRLFSGRGAYQNSVKTSRASSCSSQMSFAFVQTHVHQDNKLDCGGYVQTLAKTPPANSDPGIYSIDCEMVIYVNLQN